MEVNILCIAGDQNDVHRGAKEAEQYPRWGQGCCKVGLVRAGFYLSTNSPRKCQVWFRLGHEFQEGLEPVDLSVGIMD